MPARTSRRRPVALRVLAMTTVLTLATGLLTAPSASAAGTVTVSVLSDGVAPFDTQDTGATNGVVRTADVLTYGWSYSGAAAASTITFVQTLAVTPNDAALRFDQANTAQCSGTGGGQISADGRTLTCAIAVDGSGVGTVPITVTVPRTVANGAVVTSSLQYTAPGQPTPTQVGTTSTTVVGTPQLNVKANQYGGPVSASVNGVSGNGYLYSLVVTQPSNAKGLETVTAPLTFTADLDAISPNAALVANSCAPQRSGYNLPYGRVGIVSAATATNSVTNSGTVSCTQSGRTVTVTVTGADLAGTTTPTRSATGIVLPTTFQYLVSGTMTVFVPSTDLPVSRPTTLQYRGFDPSSISGQSNFGSGYEPGGEPTAATCAYVSDNVNRANDNCWSATYLPRQVGWAAALIAAEGSSSPAADASALTAGDGVVSPGELFWARVSVTHIAGTPLSGFAACQKWDPADERIVTVGRAIRGSTTMPASEYTVEYATLPMSTDALRRSTRCDTGTWYSSVDAAGGAGSVNAVRFTPTWTQDSGTTYFNTQFAATNKAPGNVLGIWGGARYGPTDAWLASTYDRVTNGGGGVGGRLTMSDGRLRVTQTNNLPVGAQFVEAGGVVTFSLTPVVTRATSATNAVGGVTVVHTLPSCMTYVPGSASTPVEFIAGNNGADGIPCTGDAGESGAVLTVKLGAVVPNSTLPTTTFRARALRIALDQVTADTTNTSVITSDAAVPVDLTRRTSVNKIRLRNQTQFALSESTPTPQVPADSEIKLLLAYSNVTGLPVSNLTVIAELPFSGDTNGSQFTGTAQYAGVDKAANVAVQCTADAHGTISADPAATTNTWSSTCDAATTGLRLTISDLANDSVAGTTIRMAPAATPPATATCTPRPAAICPTGAPLRSPSRSPNSPRSPWSPRPCRARPGSM